MQNIKAVAFDLWNTLIYFSKNSWSAFTFLRDEFNIDRGSWRKKIKPLYLCKFQENPESFIADFNKTTNLLDDEKKYASIMREHLKENSENCRVYGETLNVLKRLIDEGIKLTIISDQTNLFMPLVYTTSVLSYFPNPTFSYEVGARKPSFKIYSDAAKNLGVSPFEILMVGDSYELDFKGAQKNGFNAVHLDRESKRLGSIQSLEEIFSFLS